MVTVPEKMDPTAIEREARMVWTAQRLPPPLGPVGPAEGPVVHQFLGAFAPQEVETLVAQRAVAADIDARAMALAARRAIGTLRREEGGPPTPTPRMEPMLTALGVWVGGSDGHPWDALPRRAEVQTLVGRLAHMGALAVRDVSLRICPACAMARSPERIVYQEEDGETLLVRFPFPDGDRTVSALVWTDAAWRLLGTSALMVHPDFEYVIARYRRRGSDELIFTSKSSLARLRNWLPGAELEILEEHPGRHWEGRTYVHPLRHEFPMGGALEPPSGTIVPAADVSDSGTGVVPLVPGHGGTDTQIADRLNVPGWPLMTPRGRFDILLVHKYAGLELESGSEFVVRDLEEEGAIFARLRVRRGVPHCSRCGTALIWAPGRAWCLEPSRLPAEKVALYRSLLPDERPIEKLEAVPWPVSEPQRSDDPLAISLLECTSCDRLEALGNEAQRCGCGGRRRVVRRRLLPAFDAAAASWAAVDPFPTADTVRLYVSERRRAPAVVHHIAAMSGVSGTVGEVRLTVLPTAARVDLPSLIATHGADAVRAAFCRTQGPEGSTSTFAERCVQESRRLETFWRTAHEILASVDGGALSYYSQPIGGSIGDLEPEDRALLARFERIRIQCVVDYDRSAPELVHRHLFQFLENDFAAYRRWVAPRLALDGSPPSKRAALHTLVHTLFSCTQLLGPIAPHLADVVHRSLRRSRASLFQEPAVGVDRTLLDPTRAKAWDRWMSVIRAAERFRRQIGVPSVAPVPSVALVLDSDAVADEFRAEAPTIERLARIQKLEVGSPGAPWAGRRRQLRPREAEIQRVYASRAAQIIHLLRRMPERKSSDPTAGPGFNILVNGQPTQITPSMYAWEETIPERVVPVDWPLGELYAELPAGHPVPATRAPPLSPDAFRVVTRIGRRVRSTPGGSPPIVIVAAPTALAAELAGVAGPVGKFLGLGEFRIVPSDRELPVHGRGYGRTKAGAPWSFHVSDRSAPTRPPKHRTVRLRTGRVRPAFAPGDLTPTVRDYADPDIISREAGVRALGEELDEILGAPLLGPSKVGAAWDSGLQSVDAFRAAPWITLVGLPGFGVPIATALVTKFGGTVPPRPPPPVRRASSQNSDNDGDDGAQGRAQWDEPGVRAPPTPVPPAIAPRPPAPTTGGRTAPPTASVPVPPPPFSKTPPSAVVVPTPIETTIPAPPSAPAELSPVVPAPVGASSPAEPPSGTLPPPVTESLDAEPELILPDSTTGEVAMVPGLGSSSSPAHEVTLVPETSAPEEVIGTAAEEPENPLPEAGLDAVAPLTPESGEVAPASDENLLPTPELDTVDLPDVPSVGTPPTEVEPPSPIPNAGEGMSPEAPAEEEVERVLLPPTPPETPGPGESEIPYSDGPGVGSVPNADATSVPQELTPAESELIAGLTPPGSDSDPSVPSPPVVNSPAQTERSGDLERPDAEISIPPEPLAPASSLAAPIVPSTETLTEPAPAIPTPPSAPPTVVTPPAPQPPTPVPLASAPSPALSPEPSDAPPSPGPTSGGIDLAVGTSYVPSLERFLEATAAGHQGICIIRDSPERVRAYVGSRPVEIRWLTNIGRGPTLKPTDLDGLSAFLAHAVSTGHVTAFFLEGVEYLVRLHGLDRVVERMADFDRLARQHSARVWVPLNPKLLSLPELERFVKAFGTGSAVA